MTLRRVLLFGLSANPPTGLGGHAGIVRWALAQPAFDAFDGAAPDQIWILPVYRHAFASKRDMPAFEHRLAMARLAFEAGLPDGAGRVVVQETERTMAEAAADPAARIGTIDLLDHLEAAHPGTRFALLLGADTYRDLTEGKWKRADELLARVPVVAIPRAGVGAGDGTAAPPGLTEISSSAVRAASDPAFLRAALQPEVAAYVLEHGLYGFGPEADGSDRDDGV